MNGIVSLSSEQYHAAEGVSNSMLKWIRQPKTPAHFKAKYIDKLIPDEETPALRMGSLLHRCVLEPESMDGAFYVKPDGMNFATKDGKAWRDEHNDKPILTAEDCATIKGVKESVWRHPLASRLIKSADCERSAFTESDGLFLKSRFDILPRSGNIIADLKTCESADLNSVERAMAGYEYYIQAAFYLKVANLLGLERSAFVFIFVEKSPPYAVAVYQPCDVLMIAAELIINRDLQTLKNCHESGDWYGYPQEITACALPQYQMKQLEGII